MELTVWGGGKGNSAHCGFLRDLTFLGFLTASIDMPWWWLAYWHQRQFEIGGKRKSPSISDGNISIKKENIWQSQMKITLTLAHLRIGYLVGNPEVGNSEYMGHQDCPPQLVCFLWHNTGHG